MANAIKPTLQELLKTSKGKYKHFTGDVLKLKVGYPYRLFEDGCVLAYAPRILIDKGLYHERCSKTEKSNCRTFIYDEEHSGILWGCSIKDEDLLTDCGRIRSKKSLGWMPFPLEFKGYDELVQLAIEAGAIE